MNDDLAPSRNFLAGGGEMGALMRAHDWASSPLGPPATWPQRLRSIVNVVLTSRFAMWMGWGPDLTFFYNDAYAPTLGIKHGWALGRPSREVWSEIWPDIGPRIAHVLQTGEATWDEGLMLFLERSGYSEETYHTFSYSPLLDDDERVAGHLCVVTEETERCIGERRLHTLSDLAARLTAAGEEAQVLAAVHDALAGNGRDLPCSMLYLWDEDGARLALAASTGFVDQADAAARFGTAEQSEAWQPQAMWAGAPRVEIDWAANAPPLPRGSWEIPPRRVLVLPVARPGQDRPAGLLVVGLSPHRHLDAAYADFLGLIAGQIASGLGNARAYAEERRRASALAELDRAKTDFFSNVSHEFRTPLTLLLNPLDELRGRQAADAPGQDLLDVAHRNALRLLKLVNALLDFSRLEAGRTQASYEPTDLAALTAELASTFRSVVEQAGLTLLVEAAPLPQPVHVDRDMWEKVVLNLLSNAFKFTLAGEIAVRVGVAEQGRAAQVAVADTGSGIAAEELPHLFERFHRVAGTHGRSIEGSGIGLALVQELVHLHGGTIAVASEPGRGSTFTVTLPFGTRHLPAGQVREHGPDAGVTATRAQSFVAEASRWLPDGDRRPGDEPPPAHRTAMSGRVLLADDNADMRGYVQRLLQDSGLTVQAVADGQAALAAARAAPPDLLLSDVMMPGLDGFGLLAALRADPDFRALPVVLLSARAGEDARVEALQAGADGYLVKPFNARELVATLDGHIRLHRLRRENEERIGAQKRILEMIAGGRRLGDVLDSIALYVEAQEPGVVAALMPLAPDRDHFARSHGPSLPRRYHDAVEGLAVEPPFVGRSADPVDAGRAIMVPDVAADRRCAPAWRALLQALGLHAVRSTPILLADGKPAASLATYWRTVRDPTPADPTLIDVATHLAAIALERDRNERALRALTVGLEQRVAEALAERKLLADLVDGTDANVLVFDLEYRLLAINAAGMREFAALYGRRPKLGERLHDLLAGFPEPLRASLAVWDRALAGEAFTETVELDRQDGRRVAYEAKFNVLRDATGRRIGAFHFVYDVTERVANDRRLAEAQAQLHEMQKLETIGQLTGGVAHDFNNLLTPIFGALDRLQTRYGDDERTGRMIAGAMQSAERARVLVGRLLSFARRQHLEARPVPVAELVRGMAELIERSLGPQIAVALDLPESLPRARVDPNQLELALLNLCINARDAMPGGGALRIAGAAVTVVPANAAPAGPVPGEYVQLSVADTGTGMDAETLRRAVEPFYTTKGVGKGTGLGLSMVHGLAAQSGGALLLDSAPGRGTTATMLLPVAAEAPDARAAEAAPIGAPVRRLVILLVDDEELVRMAMSDMLAGMGHQVIEAASPAAALRLLQAHPEIELIVTDQMMPNMTGVALVRESRRLHPGLPALLVTGFATLDDAEADHLPRISKPFRGPVLGAMIAEAVEAPRIVPLRPVATEGRA